MRGKEVIYKMLLKEPGNGPKTTWQPASNKSDILKREYHMNRTLKSARRKALRNIN